MKSMLNSLPSWPVFTSPDVCSYLPGETSRFQLRILPRVSASNYEELLSRGWRRFGTTFFRPACPHCTKCRSLRIPVDSFKPSRSQQRALGRNGHIRVVVQPPTVTDDHLRLYQAYHADMQHRRGWPPNQISEAEYSQTFLKGETGFAREFLYWNEDRLVGVGLADVVPTALSSVYFFHDPLWRSDSPGTFSILQQHRFCQQHGLQYQYLGYHIAESPSMAYKSGYRPHEILQSYPPDNEVPVWQLAEDSAGPSRVPKET